MSLKKTYNIDIELDVLTPKSVAEYVNAILEFLLYQRDQIPMVYSRYRYFVNQWLDAKDNESETRFLNRDNYNYHVEHQRNLATKTKTTISQMQQIINNTFEQNTIKSLRFLFGATTFTPKEAYTIHIPTKSISRNHNYILHPIPTNKLNRTLINLLTAEDLYTIFSTDICVTNVYLEFELLKHNVNPSSTSDNTYIFPKQISKLPKSCKDVHFHLVYTRPEEITNSLNCCKELIIFKDLQDFNNYEPKEIKELNDNHSNDSSLSAWWEAGIIVRGFRDKLINGVNIWLK